MITGAHIKKGNPFLIDGLQQTILQIIFLPDNKQIKPIKLNYYNFINMIVDILHQYVKTPFDVTFNIFIVDWHIRKYDKDSQVYRHFFGLTHAWKKFIDVHQDAKLFLSLLSEQRNNKYAIKWFLRLRKTILKTINAKILSQISITHSDCLTICHILYIHQEIKRQKIIKKINQLFINLKRKLINSAKIDGAVACQFFMNSDQDFRIFQYPNSSNVAQQQEYQIPSNKNRNKENYNLSFSQEYANYYTSNNQVHQSKKNFEPLEPIANQNQNEYYAQGESNLLQNQNQYAENRKDRLFRLDEAQSSLNQFFLKDRNIDAKLRNSGFIKSRGKQRQYYQDKKFQYQDREYSDQNIEESFGNQQINYQEGWNKFLQNNRTTKQKLLSQKKYTN